MNKARDLFYSAIDNLGRAKEEDLLQYVTNLEQEKVELIKGYKDLLADAMSYYNHYPNNHRHTVEEYFKSDIELLQKYSEEK